MPYREPPSRRPAGVELDDNLFRMHWAVPVLIVSLFALPIVLGALLGEGSVRINNEFRPMTQLERGVPATAYALWLGLLVTSIVRHRQRLRAHLARPSSEGERELHAPIAEVTTARVAPPVHLEHEEAASDEAGPPKDRSRRQA